MANTTDRRRQRQEVQTEPTGYHVDNRGWLAPAVVAHQRSPQCGPGAGSGVGLVGGRLAVRLLKLVIDKSSDHPDQPVAPHVV